MPMDGDGHDVYVYCINWNNIVGLNEEPWIATWIFSSGINWNGQRKGNLQQTLKMAYCTLNTQHWIHFGSKMP